MNHVTAAEEINRAWKDCWDAGAPEVPVSYQNHRFEQPENSPWMRMTVRNGRTTAAALNGRLNRTPFVVFMQVFIPENHGSRIAYQVADVFRPLEHTQVRRNGVTVTFRTISVEHANLQQTEQQTGFTGFLVTLDGYYDTPPA